MNCARPFVFGERTVFKVEKSASFEFGDKDSTDDLRSWMDRFFFWLSDKLGSLANRSDLNCLDDAGDMESIADLYS